MILKITGSTPYYFPSKLLTTEKSICLQIIHLVLDIRKKYFLPRYPLIPKGDKI